MNRFLLLISCALTFFVNRQVALTQELQTDSSALGEVVVNFQQGLKAGDSGMVRNALGSEVIMFNGNQSDDQAEWEAHLFLTGEDVGAWVGMMIHSAAPHKNDLKFLNQHIRANAGVTVTLETGSNKFREWDSERVVYLLGMKEDQWKIVGIYLPEAKNPE